MFVLALNASFNKVFVQMLFFRNIHIFLIKRLSPHNAKIIAIYKVKFNMQHAQFRTFCTSVCVSAWCFNIFITLVFCLY